MPQIITDIKQLQFGLPDVESMPAPNTLLMVEPTFFRVAYVINPHMKGNIGEVDREKAVQEWLSLKQAFESTGINVRTVCGEEGFPDMVFCANQSLPNVRRDQKKEVLLSVMHAFQRKGEVPFIEAWYRTHGFEIHCLDPHIVPDFEGMGDALWHYKKRLIWGGFGFRSSLKAYEIVSEIFDVPVIALELIDDAFYHLDTCLCILNETTALIYPKAFTKTGLELIHEMFPDVIEADQHEAKELFACNATAINGKYVFIQEGCTKVVRELTKRGFLVTECSTAEYLKSGGSVFCMKMLLWDF